MQPAHSRAVLALTAAGLYVLAFASGVQAAYTPIPLAPSSFNQDFVVEATAVEDPTTHFSGAITASMDGGTAKTGNSWYEQGKNAAALTSGLPHPGVVVSQTDATASFLLQPYTGNNALMLDSTNLSGIFTLAAPAQYSALSLLTSSGNGTGTLRIGLQFADLGPGVDVPGTTPSPDWFNATPIAVTAAGRMVPSAGTYNNVGTANPRLYQENIALPAGVSSRVLTAINISWTGSGANTHTAIFALSGTPVPEPGALCVLALAATALLTRRRV